MNLWEVMFLQGSFFAAPKHDDSPLPGRTYLVTGGLAGLGLHTTLNLALRGARVFVGVRTVSKAEAELAKLEESHPSIRGKITIFELDLSSFESTRAGAARALALLDNLDGLVNNAGRFANESDYQLSSDGIEMIPQVNHFGTFIFTQALLPVLEKTAKLAGSDVRIVTVSSSGQDMTPKDFELKDESSFNETQVANPARTNSPFPQLVRYGVSKAYNSMFATELQRRLDDAGSTILSISVHPGGVATDKILHSKGFLGYILGTVASLFFLSPSQGAYTSLFALTSPEIRAKAEEYRGKYLIPFGKLAPVAPLGARESQRKLLWELTEKIIAAGGIRKD